MVQVDRRPEYHPNNFQQQLERARVLQETNNHRDSVTSYTTILEQYGQTSEALNGRDVPHRMLKDPASAIADFTKARDIAWSLRNPEQELIALAGLVDAWRTANRNPNFNPWPNASPERLQTRFHQEALGFVAEAQQLMRTMPEPNIAKVEACNQFGLLYSDTHSLPQALDAYKQAVEMARELVSKAPQNHRYSNRLARALHTQGVTQGEAGSLEEALASQNESISIYESLPVLDARGIGNAWVGKGDVLIKLGKLNEARGYFEQAKQVAMRNGEVVDSDIHRMALNGLSQLQNPSA